MTRLSIAFLFAASVLTSYAQALKLAPIPDGVTGFRKEFLFEMGGEEADAARLCGAAGHRGVDQQAQGDPAHWKACRKSAIRASRAAAARSRSR